MSPATATETATAATTAAAATSTATEDPAAAVCEAPADALPRCFDETCGAALAAEDADGGGGSGSASGADARPPWLPRAGCACRADDVRTRFGPCAPDGNRSVFAYWVPPAVCVGSTLPPPSLGHPCAAVEACGAGPGRFWNASVPRGRCDDCPPGTFAPGDAAAAFFFVGTPAAAAVPPLDESYPSSSVSPTSSVSAAADAGPAPAADVWPAPFSAQCSADERCAPVRWRIAADGAAVSGGTSSTLDARVCASLRARLRVARPAPAAGALAFELRVREGGAGQTLQPASLVLLIDGVPARTLFPRNGSSSNSSTSVSSSSSGAAGGQGMGLGAGADAWEAVAGVPLAPGVREIEWLHCVAATPPAGALPPLPEAAVRAVVVSGGASAAAAPLECTRCPPGAFASAPRAAACTPCPLGTFASLPGAQACPACPAGTASLAGAAVCTPVRACEPARDAFFRVGACNANGTQTLVAQWLAPRPCALNVSLPNGTWAELPLPAPRVRTCAAAAAACRPGQEFHIVDGACHPCDPGFMSPGGGAACTRCPNGNATLRARLDVVRWGGAAMLFSRSCTGDGCIDPAGWRFAAEFADSGSGHAAGSVVRLTLPLVLHDGGSVGFFVDLDCAAPDFLLFTLGGWSGLTERLDCPPVCPARVLGEPAAPRFVRHTLRAPRGAVNAAATARWEFFREGPGGGLFGAPPAPCDRVVLWNVSVDGAVNATGGGAGKCERCRAGTISSPSLATCFPCDPGSTSPGGAGPCAPCPAGAVAPHAAWPFAECFPCANGTAADAAQTDCALPVGCAPLRLDVPNALYTSPSGVDDDGGVVVAREWWGLGALAWSVRGNASADLAHLRFDGSVCNLSACVGTHAAGRSCLWNLSTPLSVGATAAAGALGLGLLPVFAATAAGLDVSLERGDALDVHTPGSPRVSCRTVLRLLCELDFEGAPAPDVEYLRLEENACELGLVWRTRAGCPRCVADDWVPLDMPCIRGSRARIFVRGPVPCFAPEGPPASEEVSCRTEITMSWLVVVLLALALAGVFAAAVAGAVVQCVRARRLRHRYELLLNDALPMGGGADGAARTGGGGGDPWGDGSSSNGRRSGDVGSGDAESAEEGSSSSGGGGGSSGGGGGNSRGTSSSADSG